MKTISVHSTSKNTRKSSGQHRFYKGEVGRGEGFYFKGFAGFSPREPRRKLNQPFRLALPVEKPDFTPADQEWIARMTDKSLTWDEW